MSSKIDRAGVVSLFRKMGVPDHAVAESGPLPCPLHPRSGPYMDVRHSDVVPGKLLFTCSYPGCGFRGSAFELAAAALHIGIHQVLDRFAKGGALHGTIMKTPADGAQYAEMLKSAGMDAVRQHELRLWLNSCRDKLKMHTSVATECEQLGVKEHALRELPVGALLLPAPAPLEALNCEHYRKEASRMLVMPYTLDGMIVAVTVYAPGSQERKVHHVSGCENMCGIFMEESMGRTDRSRVIVLKNELDAMIIYAKAADLSSERFNPIVPLTRDSLGRLKDSREALLLSHDGCPYPVEEMVELVRNRNLAMRVLRLDVTLRNMPNTMVALLHGQSRELWPWLADELMAIAKRESYESAAGIVSSGSVSDRDKDILLAALAERHAPEDMIAAVRRAAGYECTRTLGGITVARTAGGYHQKHPSNRWLTNFTLHATDMTESVTTRRKKGDSAKSGNKYLACVCRPDSDAEPALPMEIPMGVLYRGGLTLSTYIMEAFVKANSQFRPFVDNPAGSMHFGSIATMFDQIRYEEQHSAVGVSGRSIIYPRVRLEPESGTANHCRMMRGLEPELVRQYQGVFRSDADPRGLLARLLTSDNMAVAAFTGCLAHAMHQTVAAYRYTDEYLPRHLVVPNVVQASSMWDHLMHQVYSVMSGSTSGMPAIRDSSADVSRLRRLCDGMHGLPLMVRCREHGTRTADLARELPGSMTMMVHSPAAVGLNAGGKCYFMREDLTLLNTLGAPAEIPEDVVAETRAAWVPVLSTMLQKFPDGKRAILSEKLPAVRACEFLADWCGVKLAPVYYDTFEVHYTDERVNTPQAFLLDLRQALEAGPYGISASKSEANGCHARHSLGYPIRGGIVIFKAKAARLVMKDRNIYNAEHLTEQMRKEGMLLELIQEEKCARRTHWIFRDEIWERYVETSLELMPEFSTPKVVMIRTA